MRDTSMEFFSLWPGLFASERPEAALSHGPDLSVFLIPARDVADLDRVDYDVLRSALLDVLPPDLESLVLADSEAFETLWVAVVDDDQYNVSEAWAKMVNKDSGHAAWFAQNLRGRLAAALGYKAIPMSDEHGQSWYITPGVESIDWE